MVTSCLLRKLPRGCHRRHPLNLIGQNFITGLPSSSRGWERTSLFWAIVSSIKMPGSVTWAVGCSRLSGSILSQGKEMELPLPGCVQPVRSDSIYKDRQIGTALWKLISSIELLTLKLRVWTFPRYDPHQLCNLGHISDPLCVSVSSSIKWG